MCFPTTTIASLVAFLLIATSSGATSEDTDVKIIGGFPALEGSTLHQVSIRRKSVDEALFGGGHFCGGSLIDSRTIVTAAHCLVNQDAKRRVPSYFRVVGGGLSRIVASQNTVIANVRKVIIHENYNPNTVANDIGLLILEEEVTNSSTALRTIELATSSPEPGTVCQTTGWGTIASGVPMATVDLMAVNITVQTLASCNHADSYNGSILDGMLCVGEVAGGKDTCQGDSGGPLVCNGALAGVVSFGNGCGLPGYVGIYSDVAHFQKWIELHRSGAEKVGFTLLGLVAVCMLHVIRMVRSG